MNIAKRHYWLTLLFSLAVTGNLQAAGYWVELGGGIEHYSHKTKNGNYLLADESFEFQLVDVSNPYWGPTTTLQLGFALYQNSRYQLSPVGGYQYSVHGAGDFDEYVEFYRHRLTAGFRLRYALNNVYAVFLQPSFNYTVAARYSSYIDHSGVTGPGISVHLGGEYAVADYLGLYLATGYGVDFLSNKNDRSIDIHNLTFQLGVRFHSN